MPQQQSIPPEVMEAMLGLSEQDEDKKLLERQLYLGNMLGRGATEYEPLGGGSSWGGGAAALAKGLQGYGAGKAYNEYDTGTIKGMTRRKGQRSVFIDWLGNKQPAGSGAGEDFGLTGNEEY
jgi:hypothetical protein